MLAIERSESVSITTGKAVQNYVAEGDPFDDMGIGVAFGDDLDGLRYQGCLLTKRAKRVKWQAPLVTQMTPSGCIASMNKCPACFTLNDVYRNPITPNS